MSRYKMLIPTLLTLSVAMVIATGAFAADRLVLGEYFTNQY